MPVGWRQEEKPEENNGNRVIEIKPEMIKDAMKPEFDDIRTSLSGVMEYINAQKREREEAAEAARAAENNRRRAAEQENKPDFLLDPEGAVNHAMRPLVQQNAILAATIQRDKLLGKMDYYSTDPEFQSKVDQLISSQPLELQSNPGIIMNAYKTVHYDLRAEIAEGKVKSQASINSNGGRTTATQSGDKPEPLALTPEEKLYAKKMGISEADWSKQKGLLEYV